jgi:hypothetical protein
MGARMVPNSMGDMDDIDMDGNYKNEIRHIHKEVLDRVLGQA